MTQPRYKCYQYFKSSARLLRKANEELPFLLYSFHPVSQTSKELVIPSPEFCQSCDYTL